MKRFSFCLSFISIGLLFLTNYHPVEATNCTCNSNAIACIEDPAGQCPSGQRCNCSEHQITIDPNSGSIGCDTTQPICVSTPTSVPTPTPGGVQHGTCSGGYSDITGGCSATNDNCDQGYMPQFTNSDCTGSCWCVLSVYE